MRKYVVAIDSMKGCLSSLEASSAFAIGIRETDPEAEVLVVPVADGGEGTANVLAHGAGLKESIKNCVIGPMGNDVEAEWWYNQNTSTAYIDMAQTSGLTLVEVDSRDPLIASSYGFGQLICNALDIGATTIVAGLGGSATVDGGVGACQALGIRFLDSNGNLIPDFAGGRQLSVIDKIDITGIDPRLKSTHLILLCDVDNPFTGPKGAARVFGPQKGASKNDIVILETGLENLRKAIKSICRIDLNEIAGSGAAGGCAGGLTALTGGVICEGAQFVLDTLELYSKIRGVTALVTGEGSSDVQTLMGKLPYGILRLGKAEGVTVALVAGNINDSAKLKNAGFSTLYNINDPEIIESSATKGMHAMIPSVAKCRLMATGAKFAVYAKKH